MSDPSPTVSGGTTGAVSDHSELFGSVHALLHFRCVFQTSYTGGLAYKKKYAWYRIIPGAPVRGGGVQHYYGADTGTDTGTETGTDTALIL